MNVFNNVILARNWQLPDDDRMIETSRSIFKSFNINNLSVCIGWCTDRVNNNNNNNNNKPKEKFGSSTRKTFDRFTTKDSYTWNMTHNTESTAVWNLKPERWGSPLVQEKNQAERACDKRHPYLIIIIIIIIIYLSSFLNSCRRLPETKRHSSLFLLWTGYKFLVVMAACTPSIHVFLGQPFSFSPMVSNP